MTEERYAPEEEAPRGAPATEDPVEVAPDDGEDSADNGDEDEKQDQQAG